MPKSDDFKSLKKSNYLGVKSFSDLCNKIKKHVFLLS